MPAWDTRGWDWPFAATRDWMTIPDTLRPTRVGEGQGLADAARGETEEKQETEAPERT